MNTGKQKVLLRPAESKDAHFTFGITQNKDYQKYYLSRLLSENLNEERGMIIRCSKDVPKKPKYYFIIEVGKKSAGLLDIYKISYEDKKGSIGYGVAKEYWGNGIASEALSLGLRFMKNELKLHGAEATVDPANEASRRVLEKNGFELIGIIKDYYFDKGKHVDRALYWKIL